MFPENTSVTTDSGGGGGVGGVEGDEGDKGGEGGEVGRDVDARSGLGLRLG